MVLVTKMMVDSGTDTVEFCLVQTDSLEFEVLRKWNIASDLGGGWAEEKSNEEFEGRRQKWKNTKDLSSGRVQSSRSWEHLEVSGSIFWMSCLRKGSTRS